MPATCPRIKLSGRGLGQNGSTAYCGDPLAWVCAAMWAAGAASMAATAAISSRFMGDFLRSCGLPLGSRRCAKVGCCPTVYCKYKPVPAKYLFAQTQHQGCGTNASEARVGRDLTSI